MKALLASLVLLVTAIAPAHALPGRAAPAGKEAATRPAASVHALFLQLGSDRTFKEARQIEILVRVDGRPFAGELSTVERGGAAGAVLGVLATRPDLRDRLDRWSRDGARQVAVAVLADGREVRRLAWKALLEEDRKIRGAGFAALGAPVTVSVFKPAAAAGSGRFSAIIASATSCQDACEEDRQACFEETCPGQRSCQECDDQYDLCVEGCSSQGPCTDPPTVSYGVADPVPISVIGFGSECLGIASPGSIYDHLVETLRNYTTQTTHYCDGSSTTEVTGYWDSTWYCDAWTSASCESPDGFPGNFCY